MNELILNTPYFKIGVLNLQRCKELCSLNVYVSKETIFDKNYRLGN